MRDFVKIWLSNILTGTTAVAAAFLLSGAACESPAPAPTPGPAPSADPEASPCANVCANMKRLKCLGWDGSPGPDGKMDTADDMACAPACREYIRQDPTADGYQDCQASAATCDAMDACYDR